ncbi:hypothetical protein EJ05DRAFT_504432 [Pseudovirgaria hyperparasitica]|uniref:Zn(2)-C6 fungal-type domain-containing protein n=1 Tax=Pseudovirgaria hyperparasitica TaxID=470096 RepID=A0A6A6VZU9_9PEZI|nr:uncharacterized protein EJ05DRAFT_504432 [Pseudovirgaria hyperparasitica]KAF2754341.1 hypothetical protein EJ05DRAFT_504432 [Pseudovirgaria hyperparasitica]
MSMMSITSEFKFRRPHGKSRNGCLRCKQQRKKCDEIKPSCSRCVAYGYTCCYPQAKSSQKSLVRLKRQVLDGISTRSSTRELSILKEYATKPQSFGRIDTPTPLAESFGFFGATELVLFGDYITRTGRLVAFDQDELYVLQVGVPNLALRSRPLMASVLAFSGVSRCFQLAQGKSVTQAIMNRIVHTLELAGQHYQIALREMQVAALEPGCYDIVLANAALMVMYGLADQSLRIRLAMMTIEGKTEPDSRVQPGQGDWMMLVRTAHLAFVGVLSSPEYVHDGYPSWDCSEDKPGYERTAGHECVVLCPESGPTKETSRLVLPIIAGTYSCAFEKLRTRVESQKLDMLLDGDHTYESSPSNRLRIDDCVTAMEVLQKVASAMFSSEDHSPPGHMSPNSHIFRNNTLPTNGSPWLRTYLARVTSAEPSKLLRRTIMSFLNLVPTNFITFVQHVTTVPKEVNSLHLNIQPAGSHYGRWCPVEQLAAEIFAYWLVLVTLLDGVWWIGNLGEWELERFLSIVDLQCSNHCSKESWWPRSMLTVRKHILR